jgi:NAD(P)-dependent dehydrogenase (short-subunit alcohol dehydrogenase family)
VSQSTATRVWLITGCSTGFGRAFAEAVLQHGDRLVATARRAEQIQDLEQRAPTRVQALPLDVTQPYEVQGVVQKTIATFGQIDVLVNNAGYGLLGAIEEISDSEMRRMFETNFFGALNMIKAVLPQMRTQRRGHIINISSIGGFRGSAGLGAYCGAKFALEGISEALAPEVSPLGIHVTIVEPGNFRTNWAGGSMAHAERKIDDYITSSGQVGQFLTGMHGQQQGDPARAAQALLTLVEASQPPLRLILGSDALGWVREKIESIVNDLTTWEQVTRSTDFR